MKASLFAVMAAALSNSKVSGRAAHTLRPSYAPSSPLMIGRHLSAHTGQMHVVPGSKPRLLSGVAKRIRRGKVWK